MHSRKIIIHEKYKFVPERIRKRKKKIAMPEYYKVNKSNLSLQSISEGYIHN